MTLASGSTLNVVAGTTTYLSAGGTSMTLTNNGNVSVGSGGVLDFTGNGTGNPVNLDGGTITLNGADIYTTPTPLAAWC